MTIASSSDGPWWFSPEVRRLQEILNRLQRPLIPAMPALDALTKATRMHAELAARMNPLATSAALTQLTESMKVFDSLELPVGYASAIDSVRQAQMAAMPKVSPALQASVLNFSKMLPASIPSMYASPALANAVGQLARSLEATVEQHYDELVETVEGAAAHDTEQIEIPETGLTDFQAWVVVRVWVASLVFGWAVEDRLSGLAKSEREKRGKAYGDISKMVVAAVIAGLLLALIKTGWDAVDE